MTEQTSASIRPGSNDLASLVIRVAATIARGDTGPGEIAQLRRTKPNDLQPAFLRLLVGVIAPDGRGGDASTSDWALIVSGMARMHPYIHDGSQPIGKILALSEFSEHRLLRLLRSGGPAFQAAFRGAVNVAARSASPINWVQLAGLVLVRDEEKRDRLCIAIAKDFYAIFHEGSSKNA